MSTTLAPQNPLSYMGVKPPRPPNVITDNRAPTTLDTNYDLGTMWVDTTTPQVYFLADVAGNVATWLPLGGGATDVQTLTGNSGGMVFPTLGNINVVGDNASGIDVVGNPGTSTLTIINTSGLPTSQFGVDANTPPGTDPVLPDATGLITITGTQTAPGTIANVIRTDSLAAHSFTIEIQQTSINAIEDTTLNGVAHFNSSQFTNSNGFISIIGSGPAITGVNVDTNTPPGTDPVLANASGEITVTGAQVAAGVIGANVIRTDSLAANAYTIEIQRSTAVGATDSSNNGVCHFDSADFTVDANGFVQLAASSGFTWNEVVVMGPTSMVANNGYVANNAGLVTLTLPVTAAFGTVIRVAGKGAGGWIISQNAGQTIHFGSSDTTPGVGGSLASTLQYDSVELLCTVADTEWTVLSVIGNLTVV